MLFDIWKKEKCNLILSYLVHSTFPSESHRQAIGVFDDDQDQTFKITQKC